MNNRVLELLFQPQLIEKKDLEIIKQEIIKYPFAQSIRAINLLGIHNLEKEKYTQNLATTAAFTTDKKILYAMVNGNKTNTQNTQETPQPHTTPEEIKTPHTEKNINQEINFHENTESNFVHTHTPQKNNFVPKFQNNKIDKYEEERRKIIEQVEKKIKEQKTQKKYTHQEENEYLGNEIDLSETIIEIQKEKIQNTTQNTTEWAPIDLENQHSTFRNKIQETTEQINNTITTKTENKQEIHTEKQTTETENSNIPNFLSTWQSWLKIDRETSVKTFTSSKKININTIKEQAIDRFIATEPKISPIKKDDIPNTITIKERKDDDLSYLMTETLANIYVEQRLYNRAIEAYETLCEKIPNKRKEFLLKIEELKKMKNTNI